MVCNMSEVLHVPVTNTVLFSFSILATGHVFVLTATLTPANNGARTQPQLFKF